MQFLLCQLLSKLWCKFSARKEAKNVCEKVSGDVAEGFSLILDLPAVNSLEVISTDKKEFKYIEKFL